MLLDYRVITQHQDFAELKPIWNSLFKQSDSKTFFLHWDWQWQWWKCFGGELYLIVLSNREPRKTIAIFPFIRKTRFGFDRLKFIGSPDSDYLDILTLKGYEQQSLDFFFKQFLPQNSQIGIVELDAVNQCSPHWSYFQSLNLSAFTIKHTKKPCPYIVLPDSWEAYKASLSKQTRYLIGRKIRKLEKIFSVNYGVAKGDDLPRRMRNFIDQHQQTWNQRQRPGAFHNQKFKFFHHQIAEKLLTNNRLKLVYLELDNKPVASYYLFREGNRYFFYLSGFDPKYAQYSPSVILLAKAIKQAIEEGCEEFDLMRGNADYKYKWTKQQRLNRSWVLSRKNARVWIYNKMHEGRNIAIHIIKVTFPEQLKNTIRALLPTSGIKKFDIYFRH